MVRACLWSCHDESPGRSRVLDTEVSCYRALLRVAVGATLRCAISCVEVRREIKGASF